MADEPGPDLPVLSRLPAEPTGGPRTARDVAVDALCVLLAAALAAVGIWLDPTSDRIPIGVDVVAGVAGSVALLWRRRFPVPVAVGLIALSVVLPVVGAASAIALFTVAVHRRAAVACAVTVPAVLSTPLEYLLWPGTAGPAGTLGGSAGSAALCLALTGWGAVVRSRRQLVLAWADRARQAETEQRLRVERVRRAERERIAREMHDVLAHRLSLLSLHAGVLEYRRGLPSEKLAETAAVIRSGAHQSLNDLREIIGLLRAPDIERDRPQPTLGDLPALVAESRTAGLSLAYENRLDPAAEVPEQLGRTGYRIVQEALTNARKHAPARGTVRLEVRGGPGEGLTIETANRLRHLGDGTVAGSTPISSKTPITSRAPVSDEEAASGDGTVPAGTPAPGEQTALGKATTLGHEPATTPVPGSGTGLVGLAERVSLARGRLSHGPTRDGEFRLTAWLPWAP
ncbi:sensor histidine kinase [Streptomyces sp. NPDC002499]